MMKTRMKSIALLGAVLAACLIALWIPTVCIALQPPTAAQIAEYERDGTLKERLEFAEQLGNYKTHPHLVWKFQQKMKLLLWKAQGLSDQEIAERMESQPQMPPLNWRNMPTTGTVKVLVLLIDFPGYPHDPQTQTVSDCTPKFFGSGDPSLYPYESLHNYYQRSSYQQLDIQGTVLGWYTAQHPRWYYENLGNGPGQDALIEEALNHYKGQIDFSQFDNNMDGKIDTIYIKWTGPDTGWANFWWAYHWWSHDPNYTIEGLHVGHYVWSWFGGESDVPQSHIGAYRPQVDMHETGHALGLPDYYHYDKGLGPIGGVGGLDMMDWDWGDHTCFSKFMLDWITPTVVAAGTKYKVLYPSGTSENSVLIMPGASDDSLFGEYYMAQYRKRNVGNDPDDYPTDGMLIWHINSALNQNGDDFLYDNSNTSLKLLALVQADGLNEIDQGLGADAQDYYVPLDTFGNMTNPNSNRYDGSYTGVSVTNIRFSVPSAQTMGAYFSVNTSSTPVVTTYDAAGISATFATLSGKLTDNGGASITQYGFKYSTDPAMQSSVSTVLASNLDASGNFSAKTSGLSGGVIYYFEAFAANSGHSGSGSILSFTTLIVPPMVATASATGVTATSATLHGNLTPGQAGIQGYGFKVCEDPAMTQFVDTLPGGTPDASGNFSATHSGLMPGVTYYFKAYATNAQMTNYGATLYFTTKDVPPTITTNAATLITQTSATLNGTISSAGEGWLKEYGFTVSMDSAMSPFDTTTLKANNLVGSGNFSVNLDNLSPGVTYYFKAYATNAKLTGFGNKLSFTTLPPGPLITPAAGTVGTEMKIAGSGFGTTKGKVAVGTVALKVLEWTDSSIQCQLSKRLSPGTYDVTIQPKGKSRTIPITKKGGFTVMSPNLTSTHPSSGSAGDEILISGFFFGTRAWKGKVTLGGKSCKLLVWVMGETTGEGKIDFVVPKGLTPGAKELKVTNTVGSAKTTFTVK